MLATPCTAHPVDLGQVVQHLGQAAAREMITKLEDFLRRRSKIVLVMRKEELRRSKGLKEACKILFGKDADKRWREYFG